MDNETYPVHISAVAPEKPSRWLALGTILVIPKVILLVPHFIILYALSFAAFVGAAFAQLAVLFTGRYPKGLFDFVLGVYRWQFRMTAYFLGLADNYPPFSLK